MLLRTRAELGAECISDLTFDALRAGDLEGARSAAISQHVAECTRCNARGRALTAQAEAYQQRADFSEPLRRVRAHEKRPQGRRLRALVFSAAAMLGLIALGVGLAPRSQLRRKGAGSIGFYVRRDGQLFRGRPGEHVRPRDQLRFTWRSDRAVYLAILSLDAKGVASVYHPGSGAPELLVPTGAEVELPAAVELDATLGAEDVFVISCASPPDVERMRLQLAQQREPTIPRDCQLERLLLYKERAP